MKIEEIEKDCSFCGEEAEATIKCTKWEKQICLDCAKELFWSLSKIDYQFDEEER